MIYFLSDIHLGSRALPDRRAHQDRIIALLESVRKDAAAIYLLGDIFDYWYEYFWPTRSKEREFGPFLNELRSLTEGGIEVHFFIGNHDLWTFGQLEKRTGVIVHREPLTVAFQCSGLSAQRSCSETVVYMCHGDEFCVDNHYPALRRFFHNPVAQFLFRFMPPCLGDYIGFTWAAASRRRELVEPLEYQGEADEPLVQFAKIYSKTHEVNYIIFGHRHIELDLQIAERTRVIVLGDLFRQGTYASLDDKGQVMIHNWEE